MEASLDGIDFPVANPGSAMPGAYLAFDSIAETTPEADTEDVIAGRMITGVVADAG